MGIREDARKEHTLPLVQIEAAALVGTDAVRCVEPEIQRRILRLLPPPFRDRLADPDGKHLQQPCPRLPDIQHG